MVKVFSNYLSSCLFVYAHSILRKINSYYYFRKEYAQVTKMLGDGRVALMCYDGVARQGLIRGTMRRRVWINTVK